jgi:hypothetical protein
VRFEDAVRALCIISKIAASWWPWRIAARISGISVLTSWRIFTRLG